MSIKLGLPLTTCKALKQLFPQSGRQSLCLYIDRDELMRDQEKT